MNRRFFLTLSFFSITALFASNERKTTISMTGDLDDDLFVIKANKNNINLLDCYQMHNNFTNTFLYNNKLYKSVHVPGYIDYKKNHSIKKDEVLCIFNANEREVKNSQKVLTQRTHYKSEELKVDNNKFFPSLIPERGDVPNYPRWYSVDEEKEYGNYNYFHLWENSVVNSGFLVANNEPHQVLLLNSNNEVLFESQITTTNKMQQLRFNIKADDNVINHPFLEIDGNVHSEKTEDLEFIKDNAITKVLLVSNSLGTINIELPYPTVYINRFFIKSI